MFGVHDVVVIYGNGFCNQSLFIVCFTSVLVELFVLVNIKDCFGNFFQYSTAIFLALK